MFVCLGIRSQMCLLYICLESCMQVCRVCSLYMTCAACIIERIFGMAWNICKKNSLGSLNQTDLKFLTSAIPSFGTVGKFALAWSSRNLIRELCRVLLRCTQPCPALNVKRRGKCFVALLAQKLYCIYCNTACS